MLSANKSPELSWHPVFIYKALGGVFFQFSWLRGTKAGGSLSHRGKQMKCCPTPQLASCTPGRLRAAALLFLEGFHRGSSAEQWLLSGCECCLSCAQGWVCGQKWVLWDGTSMHWSLRHEAKASACRSCSKTIQALLIVGSSSRFWSGPPRLNHLPLVRTVFAL